jgi:hypothetical protein
MMDWFKTNTLRKVGALILGLIGIFAVYHSVRSFASSPIDDTHYRLFMDAETGKVFKAEVKIGMSMPVISPDTGKPTGYIPEECYWNADGTPKSAPTYVLLNSTLGKPGPTFCPDCGRLVLPNNPRPYGQLPPPTREQYEKMYGPIHN